MFSDEEDLPPPKHVFKKKTIKGKKRLRQSESDFDEQAPPPSIEHNVSIPRASAEPSKLSRWAKYAALASAPAQASSPETAKGENSSEATNFPSTSRSEYGELINPGITTDVAGLSSVTSPEDPANSYVVVETKDFHPVPDNHAYKTLDVPTPAKTFHLKESYFRESPKGNFSLEKEYADAYGNVSDDDMKSTNVPKSDNEDAMDEVEVADEPIRQNGRLDLGDMYDSEVSLDDLDEHSISVRKTVSIDELVAVLTKRLTQLNSGISAKTEKLTFLQARIGELESTRRKLLADLQ